MEERLDQLIVNARNLQLDKVNTKAIAAGVAAAATECEADAARQIDQDGRRQGGERESRRGRIGHNRSNAKRLLGNEHIFYCSGKTHQIRLGELNPDVHVAARCSYRNADAYAVLFFR